MPVQAQQLYEGVAHRLADRLVAELGDELEMVVLYGSVARRQSDSDSDIDILIVSVNARKIYDRAFAITFALDLENETLTTLIAYTPREFLQRLELGVPLIKNILKEGKPLYGSKNFRNYQRALQAV